jgi:hypothetical protein
MTTKQCSVYLPEDLVTSYRNLNTHVPLSARLKLLLEEFVIENSIEVSARLVDTTPFTFVPRDPPNTSDGAVIDHSILNTPSIT